MVYSLRDAARAVGRGKPAILKAIKAGRISAEKDALGQWRIDPAELHRVYPLVPGEYQEPPPSERRETPETNPMQGELQVLRETVADLRGERDRLLQVIERQALLLQDQRPRRWRWWPWKRS
jgi:hypothetical protein